MTKSWRALRLGASVESNEVQAAECEWEKICVIKLSYCKMRKETSIIWGKKKIYWEYDAPSLPVAEVLWRNLLPPHLAVALAACP